jgi:hypothetical protein
MTIAIGGPVAKFHLKRFQPHVDVAGLVSGGRVFSSFSIIVCSGILILCAAAWLFLIGTGDAAISLLQKWVALFKIREIFRFSLFDDAFISGLYRLFIGAVLFLITASALLRLMKYAFSVLLLSPDRLIIVESNLLRTQIHQIPYERIFRVSVRETILHRALRLGALEILTGERDAPLRFGPVPRFPSLVSLLMAAPEKK